MKTITIILITIATATTAKAQVSMNVSAEQQEYNLRHELVQDMDSLLYEKLRYNDSIDALNRTYGFYVGEFQSLSGFSSSTEASLFIKNQKKSFELGIFFDNDSKELSGLSFTHKYFLFRSRFNQNSIIQPYINYNFIYRVTYLDKPLTIYPDRVEGTENDRSRYSSMEHYLGGGVEINAFKYVYINISGGIGRYLGSIKKPCNPDPITGYYEGGNGWSGVLKIGVGFRMN
jgi:hypothetical protein